MRLQAEGAPDPLHRADREATVARHAARAPVRRVLRLALQRAGDDRFDARIVDRAWRTGARFVAQSLDPLVKKAAAPLAERHGMHAKLAADRLVLQPLSTRQDDPRALGQCLCGLRPGRQRRQFRALSVRQHQCFQPSSRHVCLPPQWQKASQVAPNQTKCRGRSPDMTNFWFRTLDATEAVKAIRFVELQERGYRRTIPYALLYTQTNPAVRPRTLRGIENDFRERKVPVLATPL